jgi:hypothetical protein
MFSEIMEAIGLAVTIASDVIQLIKTHGAEAANKPLSELEHFKDWNERVMHGNFDKAVDRLKGDLK